MKPTVILSVFVALTAVAACRLLSQDVFIPDDKHPVIIQQPLSPLLRQEVDDTNPFSFAYIFPDEPATSIPSRNDLRQELTAWNELGVLNGLLALVNPFIPPNSIVLAPDNDAFVQFLQRIQPDRVVLAANPVAFIANLPDTLLNSGLLREILTYHIIPQDFTEQELVDNGNQTTLQGEQIYFQNFPILKDNDQFQDPSPRRIYRSIATRTGRLMVVSQVLLPFNLSKELEGSGLVDAGPTGTSPIDGIERTRPGLVRMVPFLSFQTFVAGRSDLQILNALFALFPKVPAIAATGNHFFAPTDNAFIQLVFQLLGDKADIDPDDPVSGIITAAAGILDVARGISGLPSLPEIVLYHILTSDARYESLIGAGDQETLYSNATFSVTEDGVVDNDPSRGPAGRIATFSTFGGWVTVVDSVLLPFDAAIAKAVIDANIEVPEPTAEAIESDEESDDGVCFAGDATVRLSNGRKVRMTDLQAGDDIHVDVQGKTSKIYLFTHRSPAVARFVELETGSGRSIRLTKGHYVYSKGRMVAAGSVRIGDSLDTENGEEQVVRVGSVVRRGIFAPHSVHGDLMVDGVRVSSYTMAIAPRLAHAVLAPVRAAAVWGGFKEPLGRLLYDGVKESWLNRGSWIFGGAQKY